MKARIRKRDGQWRVELPGYGFHATTTVRCTNYEAAVTALSTVVSQRRESSGPVASGNAANLDRLPQLAYSQVFIG